MQPPKQSDENMKTMRIQTKLKAAFWLITCSAWLMIPAASNAQLVIGSWLTASIPPTPVNDEGWQRGQGGFGPAGSIFASSNSPSAFDVYANVAAGYSQSLVVHETGYGNVRLFISLTGAQIAAFTNSSQLNFTFSCPAATNSGTTAGYMQMVQFQCNSGGGGFQSPAVSTAGGFSETGSTNNNSNGQPVFDFSPTSPARSQVVTWDYSSLKPQITGSGYVQFVFVFQVGGGAPTNIFLNNITLGTPPTEIDYIVDDFATNGVQNTNPTNNDWAATSEDYSQGGISSVWSEWFGNGSPVITWNPNTDANGNTNVSGAMAIAFTWNGPATDGYQQWVIFQGFGQSTFVPVPGAIPSTNTSIGWPQYTNLECDVKFDPSSASTTNANGVLGVIRLGVRPQSGGQDWNSASYTTISDTNWHHINAPLTSTDPNVGAGNIVGVIIGEDVNAYVGGGGLNGPQILLVDNVKFSGPLATVVIPPPTVGGPQKISPALRIFAGSAVNTYDREILYTVDQNQSWVDPGATFPVKYSFSLQDYNPNINQTMVELIGGGTTPTTYGQYADYSGPTTLWLQLNPAPGGGVIASVQWKTNAPGSNPGGTANPYGQALAFTNSTAIGTWSLVFTSTNAGHVVAPGQVILGSTNFTISDGTVTSDFANPLFVALGLQANSVAGEGAYEDWGMISISGVVDGNEFEDFTKEGSDISANVTPSGFFNNSISALPASLIIQTTNDAWWVNWSQPAVNFTLASATNLLGNWINPGWYSGYSDTNAPRVMPLTTAFAGKYWVLLPKDDVPTANGQQNPAPPAAGPPAHTVYFQVRTNTVSP
jgi:hypothetical protein